MNWQAAQLVARADFETNERSYWSHYRNGLLSSNLRWLVGLAAGPDIDAAVGGVGRVGEHSKKNSGAMATRGVLGALNN